MTQRLQRPHRSGQRRARRMPPPPPARADARSGPTVPLVPPAAFETRPAVLGFPAEPVEDDEAEQRVDERRPDAPSPAGGLVVLRRPDWLGCLFLVLAGVAANVSLSLPWMAGAGTNGLSLVRRGADVLGVGVGELARSGFWQPLAVVVAGGLFVLLGLLVLIPARAHRLLGVAALIVALAAAAAVIVLFADAEWRVDRFGPGMWFAVAVPVLGVLGALKAMLTAPRVTLGPR
jgi:hypothetical protein